ncbi:lipid A biosynthesis acyltransferase [sulfur-oxidizing endosymbiont of Gigantopelta aegis]|uniref:LpxL/LpxP family acyltransferase n=1 Tax=sulfur-oxidizing endosymbiont of Gigantopelta aegis TaxID=2794934 RepID=UPI0018DE15D1|nr:lipid A biosynthesis acyltransferase [sulfur-oxidizing endosymbiont of Gigantopelta aegis]
MTHKQSDAQWKTSRDRGSPWLINLIIWIILNLGRTTGRLLLFPIVLYFVLSSKTRRYSMRYLQRNFKTAGKKSPGFTALFSHFYSFANMLLDRVFFLTGQTQQFSIQLHNEHLLTELISQGKGVVLLGSHLGNFDALRALANEKKDIKIRALMHDNSQQNINRAFERLNPQLKNDVIHIDTPESMLQVQEDINNGYIIGILADRIEQDVRSVSCQFLGDEASFPSGPLIVAHLLKAPIVICFALHRGGKQYDIYFHQLSEQLVLPRDNRDQELQELMQEYVNILELYALKYPYNWYNFYNFWHDN